MTHMMFRNKYKRLEIYVLDEEIFEAKKQKFKQN